MAVFLEKKRIAAVFVFRVIFLKGAAEAGEAAECLKEDTKKDTKADIKADVKNCRMLWKPYFIKRYEKTPKINKIKA